MASHFLQSEAFSRFQVHLGKSLIRDSGDGWGYRAYFEKNRFGSRLYVPYGPEISRNGAFRDAVNSLKSEAHSVGATFLRVEPTGEVSVEELKNLGFVRVEAHQPEFTQKIRIDRPLDEIFGDMRKSNRNLHRNYLKKGLSVVQSNNPKDVDHLIRLLGSVSRRTGMTPRSDDFLRKTADSLVTSGDANIYLVYSDQTLTPIAAAMVFDDQECRYYMHAASDTQYRNLQSGTILVSQMIEDAALSGKKWFDLYGVVPPEQTNHEWAGFSDFKRSFGGEQKSYLGTWELPIQPNKYRAYSLMRKLFKS